MSPRDAIAIVGIACRLPMAPGRDALWRLLCDEVEAITPFPAERLGGWYGDPATLAPGGFVDGVDRFDADLFGISPHEAVTMDPQQRLALELAWEGFEDAGTDPSRWCGRPVGVFVGMMYGDYSDVMTAAGVESATHSLTGLGRSIAANRISHLFRLQGPSMVIDTGQSSSLVATHQACESLRSGETELAIAGGVNLILSPLSSLRAQAIGATSPDGRAYVFDARANGFVRGEGGALVVLKRLSDAIADRDRIHAVIDGSAVNSGTGAAGLTAPSQPAQERLLAAALARAGLEPDAVGYVELHGTGTPVGDPIEAAALGRVLGAGRAPGERLAVGSIKTNVGHLEGAAGIAGLVKAALCLERGELVASLNFERPNPAIDLDALGLRVVTAHEPWPEAAGHAAGVSSFGVGGTNCHVLLSAAPRRARSPARTWVAQRPDGLVAWPLSGHDDAALRAQAGRLHEHVAARPQLEAADVGWTLASARAQLARRAVVVGTGRATLLQRLEALAAGEPADGIALGSPGPAGEVAFVFPGQGSQWPGMAVELIETSPVFAASIEACSEALAPYVGWSLEDVLRDVPGAPPLEQVDVVQPVMFSMAVSLAALWRSMGVAPSIVVGHSQGEVAAAQVAGALTLQDAAHVAAIRGRVAMELHGRGGMLSVLLDADEVQARIDRFDGRVTISVFNGPGSLAVSGELEPLAELLAELEADGVRARWIAGAYASHGPQAELIRERLLEELAPIAPRSGEVAFCSAVTGDVIDGAQLGADYWFANLRHPVRFEQATLALVVHGATAFVELSPHPVLTVPVEQTLASIPADLPVVGSLRREEGGMERFLLSVGEAHAQGVDVDWGAGLPGEHERVELPTYAFQRRRFWIGEEPGEDAPGAGAGAGAALAALQGAERDAALLALVRAQAAAVLGRGSAEEIAPRRAFKELGFDSLAGVELRNRLTQVTGLRLPATLVFDHPTPAAVAELLGSLLDGTEIGPREVVHAPVSDDEPIAIVGIGCRFPGGVRSAGELWDLVASGADAIGGFPQDRGWDLDALYDPDPDHPGTSYTRAGGFLDSAAQFDAAFFGISPREALAMDPQQRLLLETAWEALEDAGIDPSSLHGTSTGVFAGVSSQDYATLRPGDGDDLEGLRLTGALTSVVSGRVAYALGLQGPALTVDTACSSSLVALHLACQALRGGECSLALAGGVTVLATPGVFVEFSRQRGLAPDGRCKPYAASADGTGWSEGAGLLVVERLADAQRLGHPVLAIVRGSATNQDGASNGLSAPNAASQEQVIRQALANAGLEPSDVDAVEGHGTGTRLGDPIEAGALLATYGRERTGEPLALGSIKSNLGHTQAAAGVAGVIKMVMAMRAGVLPATLHVDEPSPHVDWSPGTVALATESAPWPRGERPRRAAVSSFGISGTNAHVVLEEGVAEPPRCADPAGDRLAVAWMLSAHSAPALREQAERLHAHVAARPLDAPIDVSWSLANGRARLEHRALVAGSERGALLAGLEAVALGTPADGVVTGAARDPGKVAFVFPGQGSQWPGMALELWETSPVFARRMEECDEALRPHTGWSLADLLRGAPDMPPFLRTDVVQPALFAVMVSLAGLWRSYGVEPSVVVGHSQGEIAAAHVAGALTLDDAAHLATMRSRALVEISGIGGMLSVSLPADEALARIAAWDGRLCIGSYNSPRTTVVSGELAALEELSAACEADGLRTGRVNIDYASHSFHAERVREQMLEQLASLRPVAGTIPILSTTTGTIIDGAELDAGHWYRNLREPVLFAQATKALLDDGVTTFVESSPHPVLTWTLQETVDELAPDPDAIAVIGSLRRKQGTLTRFLSSLGEAHVHGVDVDWDVAFAGRLARRVELPTYAFAPTRYWHEPAARAAGDLGAAGLESAEHPLLGAAVSLAGRDGWLLTGRVSAATHPWLADNVVSGETLLPGSALVELALRAGEQAGCAGIEELTLEAPIALGGEGFVELQVTVDADRAVAVHARPAGGEWTRHAIGTLGSAGAAHEDLGAWPPPGAEPLDAGELLDALADRGVTPGPALAIVRVAWRRGDELFAEVALGEREASEAPGYALHPALLAAALAPVVALGDAPRPAFTWSGVRVHRRGASALRVRFEPASGGALRVTATDQHGDPLLSVDSLVTRATSVAASASAHDALYRLDWKPAPPPASDRPPPATVIATAPARVSATLSLLQDWLRDDALGAVRLAVVTRRGAAVLDGELPDPGAAAVRGLVRSAASEHPGRFVSVDAADGETVEAAALATAEPEVALRGGALLVPRLARAGGDDPPRGTWRLAPERAGAPLGAAPEQGDGDRPLEHGEVRLAIRAAGLNFRDVLVALGVHPRAAQLGVEGAGVVVEAGPGVTDLAVGDRVTGFVPGAFGPLAVADARLLVPLPRGWSFAQAAAVPVAFCTAQQALVDIAGLERGSRVLIHAGAGGVGLAAVAVAQALGAEVFATASTWKWDTLRARGIDDDHLASSRDTEFAERFGSVDVVLNCLTGELVDASLGLLGEGGCLVELGSADVRDPAAVAAAHPGVRYETLQLLDGDPQRLGEILREVVAMLVAGRLAPLPVRAWDVRDGSRALSHVSQARHVGKVVLTVPHEIDPGGTVLVTGGAEGIGAATAEHLAREHGVRHLLLVSRRGPQTPGVSELQGRLARLGCEASVQSCDVADRDALAELLASIPAQRALTAVVHAAGALDDALIEALDEASLERVLRPKAVAAKWLDELTRGEDLAAFVLFSSAAATFGLPGQANYAAANAHLDALAGRRRREGLPATAVAWGAWVHDAGMTSRLADGDMERLEQSTRQRPMPSALALEAFDAALGHREAALVAVPLDPALLRAQASDGTLPALLSELVREPARRARAAPAAGATLTQQLAAAAPDSRDELVLALVRAQAAAALGHASGDDVPPDRRFKELGLDSLGSVVLRNRLAQVTGLRLPGTLVFDHPTPVAMAAFLRAQAEPQEQPPAPAAAQAPVETPLPVAPVETPLPVAPVEAVPPVEPVAAPAVVETEPVAAPAVVETALVPSPNGAGDPRRALVAQPQSGLAPARYGGGVLTTIADRARTVRFRAWVLATTARLARLNCRLVVETDGTPRFDELPHVAIDTLGEGRGSLTLRIGRDCRFGRELRIDLLPHTDGVIEIGPGCHFQDRIRLQPWGGAIRLGPRAQVRDGAELKSRGELTIGTESGVGRNATVHCHERIEIQEHVALAEGAKVMDSDHTHDGSDTHFQRQRVVSTPVLVEGNVFVGTNATILRGSRVGRNAVIAMGAVLTGGDYPAGHLLAGVPAEALRPLTAEEPLPSS